MRLSSRVIPRGAQPFSKKQKKTRNKRKFERTSFPIRTVLVSNRKGHQFHNTQRSRLQAQIRSQQVFETETYIWIHWR
jgi:hypothetical protein